MYCRLFVLNLRMFTFKVKSWSNIARGHFSDFFVIIEPIAYCTVDFRLGGFAEIVRDISAGFYEFDEVYVCVDSQSVQEVD